jgi:hypothetical protein
MRQFLILFALLATTSVFAGNQPVQTLPQTNVISATDLIPFTAVGTGSNLFNITEANLAASIGGSTFSAPVLTTSASTNSPAVNELVTAGYVQGLFANGQLSSWTASTVYLKGSTVITPNRQLWEAQQYGTSSTTMPSGTKAFTDGGVIWYPVGSSFVLNLTNQPNLFTGIYSNYPALSNGYAIYTPWLTLYKDTGFGTAFTNQFIGTNYFNFTGGFGNEQYNNGNFGLAILNSPVDTNSGGVFTTNSGIGAGWFGSDGKITFYTDAAFLGIGGNVASASLNGYFGNIMVDDQVVSKQPWDMPTTYPGWLFMDFHGVRQMRKISFYQTATSQYSMAGVMIPADCQLSKGPPSQNTVYIEGDSFSSGGNNAPYLEGELWGSVFARKAGFQQVIIGAVSGTGLIASNSHSIYKYPEGTLVPDTYQNRSRIIISNSPSLVIQASDYNDSPYASNSIYAAETNWLGTIRSGLPSAPIIVFALCPNTSASGATQIAIGNAMSNAVVYMNDPNTLFVNGLPWFTGTGNVVSPVGLGNCNLYTSGDGIHPTDFGAEYIANNFYNAYVARFGTITGGNIGSAVPGLLTSINGFASYSSNSLAPSSIVFPATTVNWTNTFGRNIVLFIDNTTVTGTAVKVNGQQIFGTILPIDMTLPLQPGEYFSETYSVNTPTARWKPF